MTRRPTTPLEFATRTACAREEADARSRLQPRRADLRAGPAPLAYRLLICDRCRAVWPTERDESHGGSRLDGEPCAYVWEGAVCDGRVGPMFGRRDESDSWAYAQPTVPAAYSGRWCDELGVPRGCVDLALVRRQYRKLVQERHPDHGGSHAAMVALNLAYKLALSELGQP